MQMYGETFFRISPKQNVHSFFDNTRNLCIDGFFWPLDVGIFDTRLTYL